MEIILYKQFLNYIMKKSMKNYLNILMIIYLDYPKKNLVLML